MSDEHNSDNEHDALQTEESNEELLPKPPPKLAARGIRAFTVCRQNDETGVSGEGVVIEGVVVNDVVLVGRLVDVVLVNVVVVAVVAVKYVTLSFQIFICGES